jgi:hypothetical protein
MSVKGDRIVRPDTHSHIFLIIKDTDFLIRYFVNFVAYFSDLC